MNINIREYKDTDYAASRKLFGELARHHAEIYQDPSIAGIDPGRGFDKYLARADRRVTWVAEDNGRIIGLFGLIEQLGEEGVCEVEPLVIDIGKRNKGLGSMLIKFVRDEAKKRGYNFMTLRPVLRNEEAFKLFVRLGFNLIGGIELFQDLTAKKVRKWKSGVEILGQRLRY